VEEIRQAAPPARDTSLAASSDGVQGEKLFTDIGCAACHVATYKTLPAVTRINGGTYKVPKADWQYGHSSLQRFPAA
jgi:CxxC motif-containing protein (DUF1111 family)